MKNSLRAFILGAVCLTFVASPPAVAHRVTCRGYMLMASGILLMTGGFLLLNEAFQPVPFSRPSRAPAAVAYNFDDPEVWKNPNAQRVAVEQAIQESDEQLKELDVALDAALAGDREIARFSQNFANLCSHIQNAEMQMLLRREFLGDLIIEERKAAGIKENFDLKYIENSAYGSALMARRIEGRLRKFERAIPLLRQRGGEPYVQELLDKVEAEYLASFAAYERNKNDLDVDLARLREGRMPFEEKNIAIGDYAKRRAWALQEFPQLRRRADSSE